MPERIMQASGYQSGIILFQTCRKRSIGAGLPSLGSIMAAAFSMQTPHRLLRLASSAQSRMLFRSNLLSESSKPPPLPFRENGVQGAPKMAMSASSNFAPVTVIAFVGTTSKPNSTDKYLHTCGFCSKLLTHTAGKRFFKQYTKGAPKPVYGLCKRLDLSPIEFSISEASASQQGNF